MSSFTSKMTYRRGDNGEWITQKSFSYAIGNSDVKIHIPKGFSTDFASIPKILHAFFEPSDLRWAKASLIHDFLYRTGKFSRLVCDSIFFEAMTCREDEYAEWEWGKEPRKIYNKKNTPKWLAWLFFLAVRIGGAKNWKEPNLFEEVTLAEEFPETEYIK